MGGLIDEAGQSYRKVGDPNEPITPRLGLFLPQMSSEKHKLEEDEDDKIEEEPEPIIYFNEEVQQQLKAYKE